MGALTDDDWLHRATAEAIAAARALVLEHQATIPMMTPIGRLSDVEWGWLVATIIFAWIKTRAEQATAEGRNFDDAAIGALAPTHGMLAPSPASCRSSPSTSRSTGLSR